MHMESDSFSVLYTPIRIYGFSTNGAQNTFLVHVFVLPHYLRSTITGRKFLRSSEAVDSGLNIPGAEWSCVKRESSVPARKGGNPVPGRFSTLFVRALLEASGRNKASGSFRAVVD